MKTNQLDLTKDQRKRLFLLARLLDRVPEKHFDMSTMMRGGHSGDAEAIEALKQHKCGSAACALGWGMTSPAIRQMAYSASELSRQLLGRTEFNVYEAIFNDDRKVTPKQVAADIRRYLTTGVLPENN